MHEAVLGGEARLALARALVATVLVSRDAELALPLDGAHRDNLVAQLGCSDRGLGATVDRVGLTLALRLGIVNEVLPCP